MSGKISFTITDAAAAVGVSEPVIRRALAKGNLVAHYPTTRPVILADDLRDWIDSAPTDRRAS